MNYIFTLLTVFSALFQMSNVATLPTNLENKATTFIIVRHAEKENLTPESNLSSEGSIRAQELKHVLKNVEIDAIYSTPYNRTKETVKPIAEERKLEINEYSAQQSHRELIKEILAKNNGKVVLLVGHSNTVPMILQALDQNFKIQISDQSYDNLFIVNQSEDQPSTILHLKYGKKSQE